MILTTDSTAGDAPGGAQRRGRESVGVGRDGVDDGGGGGSDSGDTTAAGDGDDGGDSSGGPLLCVDGVATAQRCGDGGDRAEKATRARAEACVASSAGASAADPRALGVACDQRRETRSRDSQDS